MSDRRLNRTTLTELVETHNLVLSLNRLQATPYDSLRWKRALNHAINMTVSDYETRKLIREALKLP